MLEGKKNTVNVQEGYLPVNGGNIWYKISGTDKKKIPVIVLHGGPAATHYYLKPLELLANNRPIIFYDQLGCGKSDRIKDKTFWTIEHYVEEFSQVRKALNLEKVHILGHSWGTMLAVEYLLSAGQEGIKSLVFSAPVLSAKLWEQDQRNYIKEMPKNIQKIIIEAEKNGDFDSAQYQDAMLAYYQIHLCRLDPWPECLMESFKEMNYEIYKYMWGPSEFTMTGNLKNYDRSKDLAKIKIPTLFTCGQFDEATPQSTAYYHMNLPGSEYVVFNGASHNHHLENTDLYIKTMQNFLNRVESNPF